MSKKLSPVFLCFLLLQFGKAGAQESLRFKNSPFYSDTLFTNTTAVPLRVVVENTSNNTGVRSPLYIINNRRLPQLPDTLLRITDSFLFEANTIDTFLLPLQLDTSVSNSQRILLDLRLYANNTFQDSIIDVALINYSTDFEPKLSANIVSGVADTVFQKDTLDIEIEVSNSGSGDYLDEISVVSALNFEPETYDTVKLDYEALSIAENNSILINKEIVADPQYLKRGDGNVVIVWPVGFGVEVDTSIKEVFVEWPAAIFGHGEIDLQLFPNPAINSINLQINESVERVRIFNMEGKLVMDERNQLRLDIGSLPKGVYSCVLHLKNGWKIRQKFIKS